ncbi:aryl hydrocarbon receptor [Kryptolebias marmoratus]|uniref:Aryl hydrocarbon receptor n=1 Tax=Kryptolebias marmoratus TaxID=37003 RepID=A0A3Q2ZW02_KRYMA|nr:aryl hydrocarbon receptor [Kryptolebias marmoratus]
MFNNPGTYANKKRKKPVLKQKKLPESNEVVKSNPSKRHRDRLNGELDRLMDLLPFPEEVRSRLDKLSVLRLSVGYLRVKSFFKATMKNCNGSRQNPDAAGFSEGDLLLQALNGFVLAVTSEGLVFYVSSTVQDYLGFHQSDVIHQSVFELIHTDDRALFREQLHFALNPRPVEMDAELSQSCSNAVTYNPDQLPPDNSSFLERSFVCRFRCLLDNSSGFLALKFQGRLKYLHGQNLSRDNGASNKIQLALFAVAVPVQPPSIVEIRAKLLLFQTKHKLDFTPTGVNDRGKIILGYSETELCMKGSGYQFIHAADMMYCADNHIRMIKTGESGLTVFRLLSKSNGWVWVKANAKLIYKDRRPEFIISYQKAISNAEGEEYLRQRRLQLPFSCSTGEAILYNTGPTVDVSQFQFNKMFSSKDAKKDVAPGSLLDCFLRQDENIYAQTPDPSLPVDQLDPPLPVDLVFKDSHALVSVSSDMWQENRASTSTGEPVLLKEEAKQSVMAVIDSLEKLNQNGDFETVLQHLEVDDVELTEWENCLKRFHQEEEPQRSLESELDSVITDDIIDFIDSVFKEKEEQCLSSLHPGCLTEGSFSPSELCEPQLFQAPAHDATYSPVNGHYPHREDAVSEAVIGGQSLVGSAQMVGGNQKLSHQGALITQADGILPPLQQLQLQDIFSPSIELPELTVPNISTGDDRPVLQSCRQASIRPTSCPQGSSVQVQQPNQRLLHQSSLQTPVLTGAGQMLQSSAPQPGAANILPAMIPCIRFSSSHIIPAVHHAPCLQKTAGLETDNSPLQQWPQSQQLKLLYASTMPNGHETLSTFQSQNTPSQTFPSAGFWPGNITRLNQTEQGGPTAPHSSCMFQQQLSGPAGQDVRSHRAPPGISMADLSLDQYPPQSSYYFQWSQEPAEGLSTVGQQHANINPLTAAPGAASIQHNLDSNTQTPSDRVPAPRSGVFVSPALME